MIKYTIKCDIKKVKCKFNENQKNYNIYIYKYGFNKKPMFSKKIGLIIKNKKKKYIILNKNLLLKWSILNTKISSKIKKLK